MPWPASGMSPTDESGRRSPSPRQMLQEARTMTQTTSRPIETKTLEAPGATITYDPRGSERSTKADQSSASTPEQHADDIHRVIQAAGMGPVELFASSGGA